MVSCLAERGGGKAPIKQVSTAFTIDPTFSLFSHQPYLEMRVAQFIPAVLTITVVSVINVAAFSGSLASVWIGGYRNTVEAGADFICQCMY